MQTMQRSSSSGWVKGLADMFASQGIDVPRLFQVAGVNPRSLEQPEQRIAGDKLSELWNLAVAWSGNPQLGMDAELATRFLNFDLVAYPMLASADLLSGLRSLSHYMALLSDATILEPIDGAAGCWVGIDHIGVARAVPRQRQEHALLAVLTLCRWITRRDIQPLAVDLRFPAPRDTAPYRAAFGCPLRFDQPKTRLLLAPAEVHVPLPSRNPLLQPVLERAMNERLAALGHTSLSQRVSDIILRSLPRGEPRREDVAHSLGVTERTLQRRLQDENTCFQSLLDTTRCELAASYLANSEYSMGQIADALGFADESNFFRASRRWFGVTPGHYREALARQRP